MMKVHDESPDNHLMIPAEFITHHLPSVFLQVSVSQRYCCMPTAALAEIAFAGVYHLEIPMFIFYMLIF